MKLNVLWFLNGFVISFVQIRNKISREHRAGMGMRYSEMGSTRRDVSVL